MGLWASEFITQVNASVLFEGSNFVRLLSGLWVSLRIALIAMAGSIALGIPLGIAMTSKHTWVRFILKVYVEAMRLMPQIVVLFIVFFSLARDFNLNLSGEVAAIFAFILWGSAEMGDLVRAAIRAVPAHQYESALALGLRPMQVHYYVVIAQAVRSLLPTTVNLTTRMIKTTSLVALIGVVEVLKVGQQIIDANRFEHPGAALWVYGTIFVLYFLVCFPIAWFSRRLEHRWGHVS
ncbi:amino acid ABC transporter permease [Arcanobacterium pinnipediorum]|uniref:Amino acid ABC transporter permease n=1 Tax=Arcanobacterium pinnipediorum TaxID=1503041 RepID=A0ABY5AHX2_9ACTO|nr:amino acid ABC transporter permease [Arcanobacterium pinnipediorum]USR78803.1 amino acid ABC transporter permease [Arcanobacterium pinnipediorum]